MGNIGIALSASDPAGANMLNIFRELGFSETEDEGVLNMGDKYLLVVDAENVVQHRPIETGALVDGLRVITSGITADDWVVVNGLVRARPGAKVVPQREGESPSPTAPATPVAGS